MICRRFTAQPLDPGPELSHVKGLTTRGVWINACVLSRDFKVVCKSDETPRRTRNVGRQSGKQQQPTRVAMDTAVYFTKREARHASRVRNSLGLKWLFVSTLRDRRV